MVAVALCSLPVRMDWPMLGNTQQRLYERGDEVTIGVLDSGHIA